VTDVQAGRDSPPIAALIEEATGVICDLHDGQPAAVHRRLAAAPHLRLRQLVCVLAAMVPTDHTVRDLLAWADPGQLAEPNVGRGFHADCDEHPCVDCADHQRKEVA
jgi:hypothetical protein